MHSHSHDPEETKKIINRFSKIIGHLSKVKQMVEDEQDCSEVLIQLAACKSAINSVGKTILKEHLKHCIVDAIKEKDDTALDNLNKAIDQFIKS